METETETLRRWINRAAMFRIETVHRDDIEVTRGGRGWIVRDPGSWSRLTTEGWSDKQQVVWPHFVTAFKPFAAEAFAYIIHSMQSANECRVSFCPVHRHNAPRELSGYFVREEE